VIAGPRNQANQGMGQEAAFPHGFWVVTGYLVPAPYDYLRPFYPVKRYRMTPKGHRSGPGAYPQQLMRDIADILRLERPNLCSALASRIGTVSCLLQRLQRGLLRDPKLRAVSARRIPERYWRRQGTTLREARYGGWKRLVKCIEVVTEGLPGLSPRKRSPFPASGTRPSAGSTGALRRC
jgi:hypothetical protein